LLIYYQVIFTITCSIPSYIRTYPIEILSGLLTTPPDWRDYRYCLNCGRKILCLPTSHTINKFYDLRIVVFEQINKLQISEFMYRFTHNLLLSAFSDYFSNVSDIHSYHTRSSKNLRCSTAWTNTRMFSIKCVGPCIWNNLPADIRNISSIVLYKKTIRSCINEQNQITL